MVNELYFQLRNAGYEVSKQAIRGAYPGRRGAQLLWGVWLRRHKAIHWAADKLTKRGVVFTTRPSFSTPEQVPPPRYLADPPH